MENKYQNKAITIDDGKPETTKPVPEKIESEPKPKTVPEKPKPEPKKSEITPYF